MKPSILPVVSGNTGTVRRPTPINQRLLRTKQAAAYLSISQWKLRRLTQDGACPMYRTAKVPRFYSMSGISICTSTRTNTLAPMTFSPAKRALVIASPTSRFQKREPAAGVRETAA